MGETVPVTAVITTRNRAEQAVEAATSVLAQEPSPLELFVCDDASSDDTRERFETWAKMEPRLRYHRFDRPQGGPGAGRNHAIEHGHGDWVAFLDDDDRWLPGKLAAQAPHLGSGRYDVVATNALRTSGPRYFPDLHAPYEPTRAEMLRVNPVIISSAVVRRSALRAIGGFADLPWLRSGPLDYHTWLGLSDAGARFLILSEALVVYDDPVEARLSSSPLRIQRSLLRIAWSRWARRPGDLRLLDAALRCSTDAVLVAGESMARRARRAGGR